MNDINVVYLDLKQYYLTEHPELNQYVDENIANDTDVTVCLEWKYNFKKCIQDDIPKLQEKSVDFLLKFYSQDLLCYKVVSSKVNELTVYMFFRDEAGLSNCLGSQGGAYQDEILRDYKVFMREHKLQVFQLIFGEPQEFLGTVNRQFIFNIVYILITFSIFCFVKNLVLKILLLILLTTLIGMLEKHFREMNR